FQAEDGIRDWSVTGVQTCALPILEYFGADDEADLVSARADQSLQQVFRHGARPLHVTQHAGADWQQLLGKRQRLQTCATTRGRRSEERRVGKEWRSRWAHNDRKRR